MGVTGLLARLAAHRVHVLTVEVPGNWPLRAAVERGLLARGWCTAVSSADADVVAVCGIPGPELSDVIDRIWDQMPGPRVRINVDNVDNVDSALDRAAAGLVDSDRHRVDARTRAGWSQTPGGHEGMNHGEMHHDDHQGMNHGEMEMAPEGIALAEGHDDRDGLEMDVLHVRLGPVLAHWPAGLVLRCSLQGDVLAEGEVSMVDFGDTAPPVEADANGATSAAARQCDHVVDLLALAGWPRAAAIARQARDLLLTQPQSGRAEPLLAKLHNTVRRSRLLRWSLRDLAPLSAPHLQRRQLPASFEGDAYDRLLARIDEARNIASNSLSAKDIPLDSSRSIDALPDLVGGLDVAATRLVIASLGIDTALIHQSSRRG